MQSNYDRLFQQLSELIDDREVYESLDDHLKHRVDSLLTYNSKQSPSRTINELSCNDFQNLFSKNNISYTQPYCESIVLRETTISNNPKRKHTLNSSGKITAKKIQTSAFDEERRGERGNFSKNKPLTKTKGNNKSSRDLIRYNMQSSKSKSKDKDKVLRKGPENSSKKMISHIIQRNIENVSPIRKADRQNKKQVSNANAKTEKKISVSIKQPTSQQSSMLFQPKMKTTNSNLCQSREIIKKLATLQTEHSRHSFSGSKNHSKEKRSIKAPQDKELTVMEAIMRKQQILNIQRRQSQSQIKALQDLIDKERNRLDLTNINIAKVSYQITRKQLHERGCSQQIKISRKKSENFISQSRQIQNHILQVNRSRDSITASIEEEKYLINMYLTVIEEIKSQLKIEQSQKIDLIKKLVTVKNTEKMCMEKYLSKEAVSENIFRGMSQSMKKWF